MWEHIEKEILYEDPQLLVCYKPAGLAVQTRGMGTMDLESGLKNYLARKEPGKMPYLAVIHRLDQPVEGVLVFAKTPRSAADLNRQMTQGAMTKEYLAVVCGVPREKSGILEDFLKKDGRNNRSSVVKEGTPGAKRARLTYELLERAKGGRSLLRIRLDTGRHHQIRVQMANSGMALAGDKKYGSGEGASLGLCAVGLSFCHPVSRERMEFHTRPRGEHFRAFFAAPELS
ncbi:MAG: RluA family pseudouridine synthase [Eubacteriales bacterium]|nr:RluA family pseudouridine synthase [Eubacteriales bacterium]